MAGLLLKVILSTAEENDSWGRYIANDSSISFSPRFHSCGNVTTRRRRAFHHHKPSTLGARRTVSSGVGYISSFFLLPLFLSLSLSLSLSAFHARRSCRVLPPPRLRPFTPVVIVGSFVPLFPSTSPRRDALSKKYQFVELLRSEAFGSEFSTFTTRPARSSPPLIVHHFTAPQTGPTRRALRISRN